MLTHEGLLLLFFNKLKFLCILISIMVNTDRYNCVYNHIN